MRANQVAFHAHLAAALRDLRGRGITNAEAMRHLGTLAIRLAAQANAANWQQLKRELPPAGIESLLATFQRQGNLLARNRRADTAAAVNVLALSLLGTLHTDAQSRAGVALLDAAIDRATEYTRKRASRAATPP